MNWVLERLSKTEAPVNTSYEVYVFLEIYGVKHWTFLPHSNQLEELGANILKSLCRENTAASWQLITNKFCCVITS